MKQACGSNRSSRHCHVISDQTAQKGLLGNQAAVVSLLKEDFKQRSKWSLQASYAIWIHREERAADVRFHCFHLLVDINYLYRSIYCKATSGAS
jgi:hypothetical protein